ncbi:MAG: hypothetical protein KAT34_10975 [Candidatus Aminicenantes bacterium]|nr:hypothetical protein [Candidatus Aminicenantes bacterium]
MTSLRKENVRKCFSLLKEYLKEAPRSEKKGGAILALDQLRKITAGVGTQDVSLTSDGPVCVSKPRANGTPAGGE